MALLTQAFPGGAPTEACEDLLPQHPDLTLLDNALLTFTWTPDGDRTYIVEIKDLQTNDWFRGHIIQARSARDPEAYETLGRFEPLTSLSRVATCKTANDTITHKTNNVTRYIRVRWIAPPGQNVVVFR